MSKTRQELEQELAEADKELKLALDVWFHAFRQDSSAYAQYATFESFMATNPVTHGALIQATKHKHEAEQIVEHLKRELVELDIKAKNAK